MEIIRDEEQFGERQELFLRRLMRGIRRDLEGANVPADKLHELTADLSFTVASLLDGADADRTPRPIVAFATDESRTRLLLPPAGSHLHELVYGIADDLFGDDDATREEALFRQRLTEYCAARNIEVPPGFGRHGVMRYAVIRIDRNPPKLVAVTWGLLSDVARWMEASLAPELGEGVCESVQVLDLHARQVLDTSKGLVFTAGLLF